MLTRLLLGCIRAYQILLSPLLGANCRYVPSCSAYAAESVRRHGPPRGLWLAVRRVLRCHPWHPGGYDPVPPRPSSSRRSEGGLDTAAGWRSVSHP